MKKTSFNNVAILTIVLLLCFIGLYMVYSSSSIWANYYFQDKFYYFKRQFTFMIIGLILMFFGYRSKISLLRKYSFKILLLGYFLLILVLIIGVKVNGSTSWFKIGSFLFQPSEIFKLILVFYMADRLDKYYQSSKEFYKTILILLIPSLIGFGLIMLQPDFGSAIVMIGSILIMSILSKNKFKYYIGLSSIALLAFSIIILKSEYRSQRILSFINPYLDPLGSGFQAIQSMYAIGPGGLLGKGIDCSYQKYFYLPEPQTDFIFSIYAEEHGFIGCFILIFLYGLLIYFLLKKTIEENSLFKAYLNIGLSSLIIIQICINLCVVVGLIPVTGITLPFMSYGGSSITMLLFAIGLILNKGVKNENINVR